MAPKFEVIPKSALQPSFGEAFSAAVGRSTLNEPYAYVVGTTHDKATAIETAAKLQNVFSASAQSQELQPTVIQLQGQSAYFVVVGKFASKQDVSELRQSATTTAIGAIGTGVGTSPSRQSERKAIAELLANAPVVPARELSNPR
jgi:hypothetical protein